MVAKKWDSKLLNERAEYWGKRLRNGDWKYKARFVDNKRMLEEWGNAANTFGECSRQREHQSALIAILDPNIESELYRQCNENPERILVHEHLHLSFDKIDTLIESAYSYLGSEARAIMREQWTNIKEQTINRLADALIDRRDVFSE